jgi:hypothetical protein
MRYIEIEPDEYQAGDEVYQAGAGVWAPTDTVHITSGGRNVVIIWASGASESRPVSHGLRIRRAMPDFGPASALTDAGRVIPTLTDEDREAGFVDVMTYSVNKVERLDSWFIQDQFGEAASAAYDTKAEARDDLIAGLF